MVLAMIRPYKHPKTGVYWLRDRAPSDVKSTARGRVVFVEIDGLTYQHRIGAELKVSLRTKDPAEARVRSNLVETQFNAIWESFRHAPRKLTHKEVQALAGEVYREIVAASEDDPGPSEAWEGLSKRASASVPAGSGLQIGQPVPFIELSPPTQGTLGRILSRHGLVQVSDESVKALLGAVIKIMGEAADRLAQNARGDYGPDERAKKFPAAEFALAPAKLTPGSVSLTSLVDNWAARISTPDARTIKRYRGVIKSLVAFVGHDAAGGLTDTDIVRWHRELLKAGTVSHQTFVKVHRAAISTIYSYAMSPQGGKKVDRNPAARLFLEGPKETKNRNNWFTMEEARLILGAALAAADVAGPKVAPHNRRAMRWVPWIGAYTGARPGEICQLRRQDFIEVEGIKCFALLPDAGTIKTGKFRHVPIHAHLLEQGIWEFATSAPQGPLFYDRRLTSDRPWENTTSFLSEWVRKDVGVSDREVRPGHGWRHWFKAKGRTAGIAEEYLDAICGHAPASEGRKYGGYEPPALLREIERFPRIEISS